MTVNTTIRKSTFKGTGADTPLATGFSFVETDDVEVISRVTATGVEETLTEGVHYSITGGSYAAGTVTPIDGATNFPSEVTWTLQRVTDRTQETDYVEGEDFSAESHEKALDKLTFLQQESSEDADRSLKIPAGETGTTTELPNVVDRASMSLGFDASGNPIALAGTVSGDVTVTGYMETVLDDANAAAARATLAAQEDVVTTRGDLVVGDASGDASRLALGANGTVFTSDGTDASWTNTVQVVTWPPYYESGFACDGPTGTTWEINVGVGAVRAHTEPGTTDNTLNGTFDATSFTKKLDGAAWAAGTGANGLAAGADAKAGNGWYGVFAMFKSSDGSEDIGFDSDLDAAFLRADGVVTAAGFDRFRLISYVRVNNGNTDVEPFFFNPKTGFYQFREHQRVTVSWSTQAPLTLSGINAPPVGDVDIDFVFATSWTSSENGYGLIRHPDGTDSPIQTAVARDWATDGGGNDSMVTIREGFLRCNSSKQIDLAIVDTVNDFDLAMRGFIMDRSAR